MKIKLTIDIAEAETLDTFKEAQNIALLAQKGIIEKYLSRIVSVGKTVNGAYITYNGSTSIYIEVQNVDWSTKAEDKL